MHAQVLQRSSKQRQLFYVLYAYSITVLKSTTMVNTWSTQIHTWHTTAVKLQRLSSSQRQRQGKQHTVMKKDREILNEKLYVTYDYTHNVHVAQATMQSCIVKQPCSLHVKYCPTLPCTQDACVQGYGRALACNGQCTPDHE